MAKKYFSTKTYNQIGPVCYRQWRADSHCNLIHGYALSFHFRDSEKTLTDAEIDQEMSAIRTCFESEFGAQLR